MTHFGLVYVDDDVDTKLLHGVVICVAKHLSSRQVELNDIVKQMGGDFRWTYDSQVSKIFNF